MITAGVLAMALSAGLNGTDQAPDTYPLDVEVSSSGKTHRIVVVGLADRPTPVSFDLEVESEPQRNKVRQKGRGDLVPGERAHLATLSVSGDHVCGALRVTVDSDRTYTRSFCSGRS